MFDCEEVRPVNATLRRVAEMLDERNVRYKVIPSHLFCDERIVVPDRDEYHGRVELRHGWWGGVHIDGTVPVEGAIMAVCGPDRTLEEQYPNAVRHMEFGNLSMNLETDGTDMLIPAKKVEALEEHIRRLSSKVNNQRRALRELQLKCMRLQDEILRMEDNALRMAVLDEGYSEGE